MLDFEWDEQKAIANFAKHGVSFADACTVFDDPFALDMEDRSINYGEVRRRIVGVGRDRFLTVTYTDRRDTIRLISARKATRSERREYIDVNG